MKRRIVKVLSLLFIFVLVVSLTLTLASCGKKGENDTPGGNENPSDEPGGNDNPGGDVPGGNDNPTDEEPDDNFITISNLLAQTKTNVDIKTEGVAFAKVANGVFITDGTNSIFVSTNEEIALGDKVTVEGTYRISSSQPIVAASTVTKIDDNNALQSAVDSTIAAVSDLTNDKTNFAKLFNLHGVLTTTESGKYVLSFDGASVTLTATDAVQTFVGTDITLSVITTGYDSTNGWTVTATNEAGITSTPFDLIGSADTIFSLINLPESVITSLTLPTSLSDYAAVTFTWTVESGSSISISENVATVTVVSAEETVSLKLTLTAGKQTKEKVYTVKVLAPKTVALSSLGTVELGESEAIYVSGTIVSFASNQGATERITSVIIFSDNALTRVDLAESELTSLALGDSIKVLGVFSPASEEDYDIDSITAISCSKTSNTPSSVTLSSIPFVELNSEEAFTTLLTTPYTKVTLYKITNPYFSRSTSTNTNFFRFGATAEQSKKGLESKQYTAFFVNTEDGINKNPDILAASGVELGSNTTAVYFDGYTLYAFGVYRGATTMQFILPFEDAIHVTKEAIDNKIKAGFTKTTFDASSEGGSFTLPNTDKVTWVASTSDLVISNGTATYVKFAGANKEVTLTGTYKYYGEDVNVKVVITLTGAPLPTLSVSDVSALTEDTFVAKFEGVVVGLVPAHGGSTTYPAYGVYVSDGKSVVILDKGLFTVSGYTVKLGDEKIEIGDKLYLTSVEYKASEYALFATEENGETISTVTVKEKGIDTTSYTYDGENSILVTITSPTQLATIDFSKIAKSGKIVKIVASEENPIYIVAQNAYLLALDYLTEDNKADTTGTLYLKDGNAYSINILAFSELFGKDFTIANTPVTAIGTGTYGSTADTQSKAGYACARYSFTGTLYLVMEYRTSTNYIFNGVLSGSTLSVTKEAMETKIKSEFTKTSYDASEAGEFDLPEDATWTSSSELITIANGKASFAQVNGASQVVTLTGKYTVNGKEETIVVDVTLVGGAVVIPTLSVSDLAKLTEDTTVDKLEAVVVGILPSHGGTISTYSSFGLIVSDGTSIAVLKADGTLLKVSGYTYTLDGKTVAVGDNLAITNVKYSVAKKTLEAGTDYTVVVKESGVDTSAYAYASSTSTTITNSEELLAFASKKQTQNYQVIKIVADADHPIYLASDAAYLLALDYLTDAKADSTDGTSYLQGEYKETMNVLSFAAVFGNEWTTTNTSVKSIGSGTYGSSSDLQKSANYPSSTYQFTGTLYLVYEYTTSSKQVFNAVLAGSTLTPVLAED